jgi:hypothetical protein
MVITSRIKMKKAVTGKLGGKGMKLRSQLRRALLLSFIGFTVYIGSVNNKEIAGAAVSDKGVITVKTVKTAEIGSNQTITAKSSDLYPVSVQTESGSRYGYINKSGQMMIQPDYGIAGNFSDGVAVVYKNNKYQIINQKGEVIVQSEGTIQDFHNGLAAFLDMKNNFKQGYMNTKGKVILKSQYDFAGTFHADNTAFVSKSGKFYKINSKGKILKTYKIDSNINSYNITDDGYIIYSDPKTYLKGVVDLNGKIIIDPKYGEITYLGSDLFGVKKALPDMDGYLISIKPAAIFNKDGKKLTAYSFYDLSEFNGPYASATDNKYTYFINKSGKKVTSLPKFEGRGTLKILGDVIQADIDNEMIYTTMDGTPIWKNDGITRLSDSITVSTVKLKPNKYVVVNYPVVDGLSNSDVQNAVNNKLKTLFTESRVKIKENEYLTVDDTFTVKQIKDILIINKNGYDYPIGAAHGQPISFYYFINVKTGDFYQLKDLFKKDSDYVTKLSKIVYDQIKQNSDINDVYFFESKDLISKDQYFYISDDKLTIYFDCGAIAPYAAGFPKFEIPFKDIKSIINTDGAFWKAFN